MPEPPEAERSSRRMGRSMGSTGGRLRLCAFDVVHDEKMNRTHELEGLHGVWVMDVAAAPWEHAHKAVVYGHEIPADFADARSDFIVVKRNNLLLRYDLESGIKEQLAKLYGDDRRLGMLYCRFDAFLFFRFV